MTWVPGAHGPQTVGYVVRKCSISPKLDMRILVQTIEKFPRGQGVLVTGKKTPENAMGPLAIPKAAEMWCTTPCSD